MKRLLAILIVIAGTAHGQTLGSYVGASSPSFANTQLLCGPKSVLLYNSVGTPIPTSTYVTNAQGPQPSGTTVCTTTYTGNLLGATGTLSFQGDDQVTVSLNGVVLGKTAAYNTVTTVPISGGVNGLNTFTFTVVNLTGYTGVDFVATVAPAQVIVVTPPVTPVESPPVAFTLTFICDFASASATVPNSCITSISPLAVSK